MLMPTEAVADAARVQCAAGDSWQMAESWAATTGGQGAGGCGVKILLMSYHYVVS